MKIYCLLGLIVAVLIALVGATEDDKPYGPYDKEPGFFQYANVPNDYEYEFGYNRGNDQHSTSRFEQSKGHTFRTKVKWNDAYEGHGEHYWDYNHGPSDYKEGYPSYEGPSAYEPTVPYKPAPYEPAHYEPAPYKPAPYEPAPYEPYKAPYDEPAHRPAYEKPEPYPRPTYPEPTYPKPSYPEPAYPEPEYKPEPAYKPAYNKPHTGYDPVPVYKPGVYKSTPYKAPYEPYGKPSYKA